MKLAVYLVNVTRRKSFRTRNSYFLESSSPIIALATKAKADFDILVLKI
jgi:hypothetical protein